jgi:VIT1/CCC1 family predicted Fe2+/Mn2+ transporter
MKIKPSLKLGFGFGLTSGIIATLGLIAGLGSSTNSKMVVIGGIVIIAVADAMSDSLGIHISQEYLPKRTTKEIWESTIATFISKFVFAAIFIIPFLFFSLLNAIIVSAIWGLLVLGVFSFYLAKKEKIAPWKAITEHLGIALLVIFTTHYLGKVVAAVFG